MAGPSDAVLIQRLRDHRMTLIPGQDADLLILDADPVNDPTAFVRVFRTVRGGITTYGAAPCSTSVAH
jgi:predicted amidohydrolase YtcJ